MRNDDDPDLDEAHKLAVETTAVAAEIFKRSIGTKRVLPHHVASLFLWRGLRSLRAIVGLTMANQTVEALALLRGLCELDIDFAYILKDETHARSHKFWNYRFLPDKDRYTAVRKAMAEIKKPPSDEVAAAARGIAAREQQAKKYYGSGGPGGWSGESLEARAKETGRWLLEALVISLGNSAVHPSSESFFYDFEMIEFPGLEKTLLVEQGRKSFPMHWGARFLMHITGGAAKVLEIDTGPCIEAIRDQTSGGAEG